MEVRAFRAYRFDPAVVGDVGDCIAPPYDVISEEQQERLYAQNEHNIVRISRAKSFAGDSDTDNQYTRARGYLNEWISSGALKQDSAEAIYGYVQDYDLAGSHFQRLTFIALAKLEDFGKIVKPHEETLEKPMQDRLNLTRATAAQFGLVFMLYNDERGIADRIIEGAAAGSALIDFTDEQGVRHRLYAITARKDVDTIARMMRDKSVIIADGHHRYTTGLMYSRENSNPAAKYQMLAFTNMAHEGLTVLATHRLVANLAGFDMKRLIADLGRSFKVTAMTFDDEKSKADAKDEMLARMKRKMEKGGSAFVIYGGDGAFYLAALKDGLAMDSAVPERSAAYRSLDVAVLHRLILEELLGIDEQCRVKGENLEYVKGTPNAVDDSIARVDAGEKQAAFFVNPIRMSQLIGVTDAGERMPQKSTYFYPKMFTGLTINKL